MPNIDSLTQTISHHWYFNVVSGDMTGTYRFKTGLYGLTDMPAKLQKAIDCTLAGLYKTLFSGDYNNSE